MAKILLCGIAEILLSVFSARTFMVSQLTFKSFIYFEFILVSGVSWWSSLIFLHVPVEFSQHYYIEEVIFTPFYAPAPFVKHVLTIETWVYFWVLYSVPLIHVSVLVPVPDCFDYSGLVV